MSLAPVDLIARLGERDVLVFLAEREASGESLRFHFLDVGSSQVGDAPASDFSFNVKLRDGDGRPRTLPVEAPTP